MENRQVWVFYVVVASLWAFGVVATATRHGAASRNHQRRAAAADAPSAATLRFAIAR
jgi:hypothetical protein